MTRKYRTARCNKSNLVRKESSVNEPIQNIEVDTTNKIKINSLVEFTTGEDWLKFQENLNKLLIDFKVTDDERKVGFLITLIGQDAFKSLKESCYPESPLHKKYDDLVNTCKLMFPKKPIFKERKEFYKIFQKSTESVSGWYERIIEKVAYCRFDESVKQQIVKDKFVTGLYDGPLSCSLSQEDVATDLSILFNKAIELEKEFQTPTTRACHDVKPQPLMNCTFDNPELYEIKKKVYDSSRKKKQFEFEPRNINHRNEQTSHREKMKKQLEFEPRYRVNHQNEQHQTSCREEIQSTCKHCGGTRHDFNNCRFKNNIMSKDKGVFGVCPHLHSIKEIPMNLDKSEYQVCMKCNSEEENYVCLICFKTYCARFVNKHALEHYTTLKHPLSLALTDTSAIWCYECDAYIENPGLQDVSQTFENLMLQE